MPADQITHEFLCAERMALAHPVGDGVIVLNRAAADAFDDISESLVTRSSGMERGVDFESVRSELLNVLANYVGSDADSINADTVATLHMHLEQWFSQRADFFSSLPITMFNRNAREPVRTRRLH